MVRVGDDPCKGTGFVMRRKSVIVEVIEYGDTHYVSVLVFDGWQPCQVCNSRESITTVGLE